MRQVVCSELGPPEGLVVEDRPELVPGEREVLVDVRACGVNYVDALFVQGGYQIKPPLPFVPGSEIAGIVSAVGRGVEAFVPGDPVFAMCGTGGFSEQVVVPAASLVPVGDGLDLHRAASMGQSYSTALFALTRRTTLDAGETVKVRARELSGGGVDVVYDPVGGRQAEPALRALRVGGRFLVIGFAAGQIPSVPLNQVLLNNRSVVGIDWGLWAFTHPEENRALFAELLGMVGGGALQPTAPSAMLLEEAPVALRALLDRNVTGKLVLVP